MRGMEMLRQSMDDGCKLNGRFPRPDWGLKIYVSTRRVLDFTAPCAGRHGEQKHSLAARLDCPVNDDSIPRGSLIFGVYYQIIRAIEGFERNGFLNRYPSKDALQRRARAAIGGQAR
jgi:hypothetical protein